MAKNFNFKEDCTYSEEKKSAFHAAAKRQLRKLAKDHLKFDAGTFDLRSNKGGPAVSGEITLHHNDIYIQVSQSAMGSDNGVLLRTCKNRKDYTGGQNHFATADWLNDGYLPELSSLAKRILEQKLGHDGDARESNYNATLKTPRFSR